MTTIPITHPAQKLLATTVATAFAATCLVSAATTTAAVAADPVTSVTVGSQTRLVNGTDVARATNYLVVYTSGYGATTGSNEWGTEVAVVNGTITKKATSVGNMAIPAGGYVLSGHGTSRTWLQANANVGMTVTQNGTVTPPPPSGDSYLTVLRTMPGLTHYYPLDAANQARDLVGTVNGSLKGTGVTFSDRGATFTGKGYIELPDHNDFSVATKGGFTVLVDLTVDNWHGAGASEYIHWMGKGVSGGHEWTFRHYVQGGSGEASSRQGRVSFYHFNPSGGLGAGSYFQDAMDNSEHVVSATADLRQVQMYKDGKLRDTDLLSGYGIVPKNTTTPVRIGSRGDNTGFLVGKVRRVAFFNRVLTAAEMQKLATAARQ
jgi:hypothetical protein